MQTVVCFCLFECQKNKLMMMMMMQHWRVEDCGRLFLHILNKNPVDMQQVNYFPVTFVYF